MARLGTPGQPDPRVEGKIELGELIMAFLRFDFDTAGSLEVNHGGCADEFLADHDGFHSVQAGSGLIRSEEHTSELQSLMRISYAVFCLKKKKKKQSRETKN